MSDPLSQRRFAALFYILLLSMAIVPLFPLLRHRPIIIEATFGIILASGMVGERNLRVVRGSLALLGFAVTLRLLAELKPQVELEVLAGLAFLTIGGMITKLVADFALKAKRVDAEHLYAALSVYLLLGLLFAGVFLTLQLLVPGSLSGGPGPISTEAAVYFSFVTLATLGYGDIVPLTSVARGLAVIEAVVGQFYIAVMVARMVTLYASGLGGPDQNASSRPK